MSRKKNLHHIKPRCRGGQTQKENMLRISVSKHTLLHVIFGSQTLYEIILGLIRIARMKHYERVEPEIKRFYDFL